LKPTIYALSVIERKHAATDQSSNGFVRPIYDFCICRVPYSTPCSLYTLRDEVLHYVMMLHRYAMNAHSDSYQTTVVSTYGSPGSDVMCDGSLCLSIDYEQMVPPPMTPMVATPYVPTVLSCFEHSESHGCFKFGFCSTTTKLNLRDLILLDNQSTVDIFCNKRLLKKYPCF